MARRIVASTAEQEIQQIRRKLGHLTMEWKPSLWLDTGFPSLNEVLGSTKQGIPFGRIMELFGRESHGKSAVALALLGLAQRQGAAAVWADFESTFDPHWATMRGVDCAKLRVFQPYVGTFGKDKSLRLVTAQELCAEIEQMLAYLHRREQGKRGMIVVVDSVPAMLPDFEAAAGLEGQGMRTRQDLPMFMSSLLRRWVGLAHAYSALIIFINQMRQKPMAFGDPWYTPGGNALKFYSHIRVQLRRLSSGKGGRILKRGRMIGIQGVMTAVKNKTGGTEGAKVGYRLMFNGPLEFMPADKLRGISEAND